MCQGFTQHNPDLTNHNYLLCGAAQTLDSAFADSGSFRQDLETFGLCTDTGYSTMYGVFVRMIRLSREHVIIVFLPPGHLLPTARSARPRAFTGRLSPPGSQEQDRRIQ